ncbi:MAG: sulfotransferase, partial [Pseudomonadota bacterium]
LTRAAQAGGPRLALLAAPAPRSGSNFIEALAAAGGGLATAPLGLAEAAVLAEGGRLEAFRAGLAARHASAAGLEAEAWLGFALAGFARAAAVRHGTEAVLLKDPQARGLARAVCAAPEARLILVLRDGRRVVDSALRTWPKRGLRRWLGRSLADHADEWARGTEALLDLADARPEAMALRYEAAASDPVAASARLRAHLGLPRAPEAAVAAAAGRLLGSSRLAAQGGAVDWRPRARPDGYDPAGREVDWPASWERTFERVAGDAARRLADALPASGVAAKRTSHAPAMAAE